MSEFYLADLVEQLNPRLVVELGTGDGASAAGVMMVLPSDGRLFCVNWPNPPSGDNPWRYLAPWAWDKRHLVLIFGDTRDPNVVVQVPGGIELLHIDSTHTDECASEEWRLYEPKLADRAVVVVDDLDHNDMAAFWRRLVGKKEVVSDGRIGVLRYER